MREIAMSLHFGITAVLIGYVACPLADTYPNKPIRIVTAEPGGSNDFTARLVANGLTPSLNRQVIVDNRGGANGFIAAQIVANAPRDGYTLLFHSSALWTIPLIQPAPYDPVKDFSPISLATSSPTVLVLHPAVNANSVRELIALAKANPGKLNYASGATGSSNHVAGELFKYLAGIEIMRIPYKGSGQALNGLIGGQVQMMFAQAATVAPHIKTGRLKALAVTSEKPSALMPDLPTVAASGLPGYQVAAVVGAFAPRGTPSNIVMLLNREIVKVLSRNEVKEKLLMTGVESVGDTPQEFERFIKADMETLRKVIVSAGIRSD